MNDNRITLKGYITEIFETFSGEKNLITRFRIRHMHLDDNKNENGDSTIYEIAAYNEKGDLLSGFAKNMKVEVVVRLFCWKKETDKFNGMQMQMRLSKINIAAGNVVNFQA